MSRESADMITDLILMLLGEENNVYKSVWVSTFRLSLQPERTEASGSLVFMTQTNHFLHFGSYFAFISSLSSVLRPSALSGIACGDEL